MNESLIPTALCEDGVLVNDLHLHDFARVYQDHRRAVFGIACATVGPDLAGDVTQETFLRFWQYPERYDPTRGSIRGLLMTMARNIALDMARRHRSQRAREARHHERTMRLDPQNGLSGPDDAMALQADLAHLQRALDRLTPVQHEAVLCISRHDCSYRQAAQSLGIAEGTLKNRIRSSLRVLRTTRLELAGDNEPSEPLRAAAGRKPRKSVAVEQSTSTAINPLLAR